MMSEKITVIIPTYRRPRLLIKCLEAIAAQTISKSDYMVIVVSDGPDFNTRDLIETWRNSQDMNVIYMHIEKKGPAAARNYGWKNAKTPIVAFTDDDCLPAPHWLAAFLDAYSGQKYIAYSGQTKVPLPAKITDFAWNTAQLESAEFITANCACTRAALLKAGGFDERFALAWREDSDLQFKFIVHQIDIIRLNEALVIHPVREVPWGISLKEQKKGLYDALLFKKYPNLYRRKIQSSINRYYLMALFTGLFFWSIVQQHNNLSIIFAGALILLYSKFILKRLHHRHKSLDQVSDMVVTSLFIPFLSIFWRIYGAIKYRIVFL